MARPSKQQRLDIWMNGELVGHWKINAQGVQSFNYAETWFSSAALRPLSLSMPLQPPDIPYRGQRVAGFFENLLPDSSEIRRRIQLRFSANSTRAFDLLAEVGRDCVGAIQLLPMGEEPDNIHSIQSEELNEAQIARELRNTTSTPALGQKSVDEFRISIAGAQEKTAFLWHQDAWNRPFGATPTTHIFKLPLGHVGNNQADLTTSVENEWLCTQIAKAYGLPVENCEIGRFEDQQALIVERFDRKLSSDGHWWLRLPQEDMCQATATPPELKYEADGGPGIQQLMELLLGSRNANTDRKIFFKTQLFFWILAAPDGHAKNFSLFIEAGGRYRLTPLYDIISAHPILGKGANQISPEKLRIAMAVRGKNRHYRWLRIFRRHWLDTAKLCGVDGNTVEESMAELIEATPKVIEYVSKQLPADFPVRVSETIFKGIEKTAKSLGS